MYEKITSTIREYKGLSRNCLKLLRETFPNIQYEVLCSILSSEYQKLMKFTYTRSEWKMNKYYNMYKQAIANGEEPGIIINIARKVNIAPCLIAKLILKCIDSNDNPDQQTDTSNTKINKLLKDTNLITDQKLAHEIFLCTLYDDQYSPIVEAMKNSVGQQYEIKLYKKMSDLGIAFRDEIYLRKFGYDKTPDVKLEIPIAVNGFIIHWIESKAMFGDYDIHQDYVKKQYSCYWNRFGSGLVIYWFGYLETVKLQNDKRFIVSDHLPENLTCIGIE